MIMITLLNLLEIKIEIIEIRVFDNQTVICLVKIYTSSLFKYIFLGKYCSGLIVVRFNSIL